MFNSLPPEYVLLVLGPPGVGKLEFMLNEVKETLEQGTKVIFIAVDTSPNRIRKVASNINLDTKSIEGKSFQFIDCYAATTGHESEGDNTFQVNSLSNIEQIGMQLMKAANRFDKPLRMYFYTASPLFLYNSNQAISRFFQVMTSQIRGRYGSLTCALHAGVHEPMTVATLKMFVDGVVEMTFDDDMRHWVRMQYFKGSSMDTRWYEFYIKGGAFVLGQQKRISTPGLKYDETIALLETNR